MRLQAIELDQTIASAYGNRGSLYAQRGEYAAAKRDYQQAAQLYLAQDQQDDYLLMLELLRTLPN